MKTGQFTNELVEQMEDAATATSKAYANLKRLRHMETGDGGSTAAAPLADTADDTLRDKKKENEKALSPEIAVVEPIFRFFQLLCENHNLELQVGVVNCGFVLKPIDLLMCFCECYQSHFVIGSFVNCIYNFVFLFQPTCISKQFFAWSQVSIPSRLIPNHCVLPCFVGMY